MPQDTGVGRNVVLDGLDFASLRRVWEQTFGLLLQARSRVFSCAAFSCTNASAGPMAGFRPQPGALWLPWRTRHQVPALPQGPFLPGTHLVREWNGPDPPGRGNRQRAIGSMAKPIRPSPPSQSESPEPTGLDHAFSV